MGEGGINKVGKGGPKWERALGDTIIEDEELLEEPIGDAIEPTT